MQELANTLTDLLPYVYDVQKFEDASNKKLISEKISKFKTASHAVPKDKADDLLGQDPLVTMSIENLEREIESAQQAYEKGNTRYSRHLLQHTLNYCFACHTRSQMGPKYDYWNLTKLSGLNISPLQRSQILVATRQFDQAKDLLKSQLIRGPEAFSNPYMQEQAIKRYLAIVVKAENSPTEGYKFINEIDEKSRLPVYLSKNLHSWEESFVKWMAENKNGKPKNLLAKAKRLIEHSDFLYGGVDGDGRYVDYLRASSLLHESLGQKLTNKQRAEAYLRLGVVYNLLSDSGFWELPEGYFEACIREWPKSSMAKDCYRNYEQNVVIGYSGSAGTFIPGDERKKLANLKKLAGY